MNRLISLVAASLCAASITAAELPECIGKAAREFNVPPHLLEAMALQEMDQPPSPPDVKTYGPMGLSITAMRGSARAIGVSPRLIAIDPCSNYRAAAFWLTGPSYDKADVSVWQMVNRYY